MTACHDCGGTGLKRARVVTRLQPTRCPTCAGTGRVEVVEAEVPCDCTTTGRDLDPDGSTCRLCGGDGFYATYRTKPAREAS